MLNYLLLNDYLLALHNLHFSGFLCAKMQMAAFNLTSSKFSGRYIRTPLCWGFTSPAPVTSRAGAARLSNRQRTRCFYFAK